MGKHTKRYQRVQNSVSCFSKQAQEGQEANEPTVFLNVLQKCFFFSFFVLTPSQSSNYPLFTLGVNRCGADQSCFASYLEGKIVLIRTFITDRNCLHSLTSLNTRFDSLSCSSAVTYNHAFFLRIDDSVWGHTVLIP